MAIINTVNVKGTSYDVGLNSNAVGAGLKVSNSKITIDTAYGLDFFSTNDEGGTGLGVKTDAGLQTSGAGVSVKASNGITVNSNGVSVKAGSGITVDANGVNVKLATDALTNTTNGVSLNLKIKNNSGIYWSESSTTGQSGLYIKTFGALYTNSNGIGLKLDASDGSSTLNVDGNNSLQVKIDNTSIGTNSSGNLTVKAGSGITVNSNGVSMTKGSGLTYNSTSKSYNVGAGSGITVNANNVCVKTGSGLTFNSSSALTLNLGDGLQIVSGKLTLKTSSGFKFKYNSNGEIISIDTSGSMAVTD